MSKKDVWHVNIVFANYDKMKCYPDSEDCKSEYDLVEKDFHTEARCDFFKNPVTICGLVL